MILLKTPWEKMVKLQKYARNCEMQYGRILKQNGFFDVQSEVDSKLLSKTSIYKYMKYATSKGRLFGSNQQWWCYE